MEFISSDTNVWLDFVTIDKLPLPFRLPYVYLMDEDTIADELLSPVGLSKTLLGLGLKATELSEKEYLLAEEYTEKYSKPSTYDCVALAIAKCRNIVLLTGDGALRKAAAAEGVTVMGTIGVLDQLLDGEFIDSDEYVDCMKALKKANNGKVRLPEAELQKRIDKFENNCCH